MQTSLRTWRLHRHRCTMYAASSAQVVELLLHDARQLNVHCAHLLGPVVHSHAQACIPWQMLFRIVSF